MAINQIKSIDTLRKIICCKNRGKVFRVIEREVEEDALYDEEGAADRKTKADCRRNPVNEGRCCPSWHACKAS